MNRVHFIILLGLELCILLTYVIKDSDNFKDPKFGVVSLDKLVREEAEKLAKQDLKPESLTKAIHRITTRLNHDLKDFAIDKKVVVFSAQALKGGAEDLTEEFKVYLSQKQKGEPS
ncbi:MAG: hypothetical protein K2W94_05390 [Alphaproteobacteria bacterium]|nr:hypothetical protein [Alphaproteobacteria bacterium]